MAFKRDSVTFARLKALNMRQRLDIVSSSDTGPGLYSMLTPTDLALLFPTYYKKILPDVGGFRAAISKASSEQQSAAQGALLERLSAVEKTASSASIMRPWAERVSGAGARPPAQLSSDQMAAWNKLQQGALDINSPEGKIFGKLTDAQLASLGISKTKNNTGVDVYQYKQPEVTQEEALDRMQQPSGGNMKQIIDNAAKKYGVDPRIMYGIVAGESGAKTKGGYDVGDVGQGGSFGPFQLFVGGGEGNKFMQMHPGANLRSASSIPLQADYVAMRIAQIQKNKEKGGMIGYEVYRDESRGGPWHGFTGPRDWDPRWFKGGVYENIGGASHLTVEPAGPGGQYTPDQINKMMDQIKSEKNDQRRQELATILVGAGQSTSDVQAAITGKVSYGQVKDFSQYILHEHSQKQCGQGARILAGHMYGHGSFLSEGLGVGGSPNAGSLSTGNNYFQRSGLFHQPKHVNEDSVKNQAYLDSLPIGTVVSATKSGGAGHVQVKIGPNQWASDFKQQHFISNGYSNFAVHMPNDAGLEALRRNGVDQSVTALSGDQKVTDVSAAPITSRPGEAPETPPPPPPATPPSYNPDSGDDGRPDHGGEVTASVGRKEAGYQQPQEELNKQAVQDIKNVEASTTSAPAKPEPSASPNKYKLDTAGLVSAIRQTEEFKSQAGFFADAVPDSTILNGFFDDARVKAAGVTYDPNTGVMNFKNPDDPQVKAVMAGFDTKKFMKPIEEPKPKVQEAPKEVPKKQEPPKPTATVEQRPTRPGEPLEAKPTPPPEPAPKAVPGFSDGGSFQAPEDMKFYKVNPNDNIVAINPQTQQPIATMKSGEGLSSGDSRVDVTPQSKTNDAGPLPDTNNNQLTNLVASVTEALSNIGTNTPSVPKMASEPPSNHANLIDQTNRAPQPLSPSFARAMHRTARGTEPGGTFDHFSYGNK